MPYYFNLPLITELTPDQQRAVDETNPLALSGGPGTGKSVVGLWRHIRNHSTGVKNSLLLTYTKTLEHYLKASAKHLGDENIATAVLEGNIADAILDYAKKESADLLVLGSHSHSGLFKLFIGDVAEKILKHSTIPLLIIPQMILGGAMISYDKINKFLGVIVMNQMAKLMYNYIFNASLWSFN